MKNNSEARDCKGTNRKGKPCGAPPVKGSEYCVHHGLEQSKAENVPHSKKSSVKTIISIVGGVVGLVSGIICIWILLNPTIFVEPGVAFDPNKPAFTTFTTHNQGLVCVYDVTLANSIKYLDYPGKAPAIGLGEYTNRFTDPNHFKSKLCPGKPWAERLALSGLKNDNFENADIAIVVTYTLLWQREPSLHRFVSRKAKDGQWHWQPKPIKK